MSENIRLRGKYYYYDMMIDGIRYKGTTKTADKKLAEKIAATIKTDILRQKHDLPTVVNYSNEHNLQDLWEQYIKSLTNVDRSIKNKISISQHFLPVFKDKNIKLISNSDIENYQLKRRIEVMAMPKNIRKRESEVSFCYMNKEITTLRHFFNYCIKKGFIDKNPCAGIKKLNELSRLKTLNDEDIQKLISGGYNFNCSVDFSILFSRPPCFYLQITLNSNSHVAKTQVKNYLQLIYKFIKIIYNLLILLNNLAEINVDNFHDFATLSNSMASAPDFTPEI
jgi:hypothetical protein